MGKSTGSIYIAAKVSRGGYWPDKPNEKIKSGSVIILTIEDDPCRTVRPRLEAAGANMDKVLTISAIKEKGDEERNLYNLIKDRDVLIKAMRDIGDVRLVIIDPISNYMGDRNQNSNSEVREFLAPLIKLAEVSRAAILGIHHLNKDNLKPAAYRTLGSIAWTAVPRVVWLLAEDPDNEDKRLLVRVKNNLSRLKTGLAFKIESVQVQTENGPGDYPVFRFDGIVSKTADEILDAETCKKKKKRIDEAMEWLEDKLSDSAEFATNIIESGKRAGHSKTTLERAKKKRGIESIPIRNTKGEICAHKWALPKEKSQSANNS